MTPRRWTPRSTDAEAASVCGAYGRDGRAWLPSRFARRKPTSSA
jgi:hypothetical protein